MIFLDPDRSEGSKRAQKASRSGRDPLDLGHPLSQRVPDCSKPLKTSQKALQKRGILMKSKDPGSPDVTKTMKFIDFGGEKVTFRL